jgi:glycosyltransferase involved in cell wall biosynthesis
MAGPELSVIVPCRDGGGRLSRQLASLAQQTLEKPFEVIVVDDGPSDGTRLAAEAFSNELLIRFLETEGGRGPAHARNVGAHAAASSKLLFVDADDEVGPEYLAAMDDALESSSFVMAKVDLDALNPEWVKRAHGSPWHAEGIELSFGFLPGASSCIGTRKEVLERVGGWPEDFPAQEDTALAWRVQLAGFPLTVVDDAVYRYAYGAGLLALFRQSRRWSEGLPLLYREFGASGMAPRPAKAVRDAWVSAARALVAARSKAALASALVQWGDCLGRIVGSLRYRTLYL